MTSYLFFCLHENKKQLSNQLNPLRSPAFVNETDARFEADFFEEKSFNSQNVEGMMEQLSNDDYLLKPISFIRSNSRSESDLKSIEVLKNFLLFYIFNLKISKKIF